MLAIGDEYGTNHHLLIELIIISQKENSMQIKINTDHNIR